VPNYVPKAKSGSGEAPCFIRSPVAGPLATMCTILGRPTCYSRLDRTMSMQ